MTSTLKTTLAAGLIASLTACGAAEMTDKQIAQDQANENVQDATSDSSDSSDSKSAILANLAGVSEDSATFLNEADKQGVDKDVLDAIRILRKTERKAHRAIAECAGIEDDFEELRANAEKLRKSGLSKAEIRAKMKEDFRRAERRGLPEMEEMRACHEDALTQQISVDLRNAHGACLPKPPHANHRKPDHGDHAEPVLAGLPETGLETELENLELPPVPAAASTELRSKRDNRSKIGKHGKRSKIGKRGKRAHKLLNLESVECQDAIEHLKIYANS